MPASTVLPLEAAGRDFLSVWLMRATSVRSHSTSAHPWRVGKPDDEHFDIFHVTAFGRCPPPD